ncbi:MAG TPA: phosphoglycerol geranylgeranyltransferase [Clostridia bacterium]
MSNRMLNYIKNCISQNGFLFAGVLDPENLGQYDIAAISKGMERGGVDVILLGGSSGTDGEVVNEAAKALKERVKIPIICFPGNVGGISKYTDAVLYLSVMNTESSYWGVQARVLMAPFIKRYNIEAIPAAYVLMEKGETAAWVSQARPVPRNLPYIAEYCALAGEYSGAQLCIMDSGSNSDLGIPIKSIKRVAESLSIPLIYAGGVSSCEEARDIIEAGAEGIQIGSFIERSKNPEQLCRELRMAMAEGVKRRRAVCDEWGEACV